LKAEHGKNGHHEKLRRCFGRGLPFSLFFNLLKQRHFYEPMNSKLKTEIVPRGRHAVFFRRDVPKEEGLLIDPEVMKDPSLTVEAVSLFVYISGTVLASGRSIELEELTQCQHKNCRKSLVESLLLLKKRGLISMRLRKQK